MVRTRPYTTGSSAGAFLVFLTGYLQYLVNGLVNHTPNDRNDIPQWGGCSSYGPAGRNRKGHRGLEL